MTSRNAVAAALGAAAVLLPLCMAQHAAAEIFTPGIYTLIGYSAFYPDFKKTPGLETPSYMDGGEIDAGWRFNRFYSIEASYAYDSGSKNAVGANFRDNLQTAALDAVGYLPIGYSAWALFGKVGAGATFSSAQSPFLTHGSQTAVGLRAGGGLLYQFDDHLGVRLTGLYERTGLSIVKSATVGTFGLIWQL